MRPIVKQLVSVVLIASIAAPVGIGIGYYGARAYKKAAAKPCKPCQAAQTITTEKKP